MKKLFFAIFGRKSAYWGSLVDDIADINDIVLPDYLADHMRKHT